MKLSGWNLCLIIIALLLTLQILRDSHYKELGEAKTEAYIKGSHEGFNNGWNLRYEKQKKLTDSLFEDLKNSL